MNILHISTECYPAAKSGGLGDVVGAVPKYLRKIGAAASVVIPKYQTDWIITHEFTTVYKGSIHIHKNYYNFSVEKEKGDSLGFPLFVVKLPEMFDRPGIYTDTNGVGFQDNMERFLAFNLAVLQWLVDSPSQPEILHCHDHPTGMIPYLTKAVEQYRILSQIPTMLTIHNAAYHGEYGWEEMYKLPWFAEDPRNILDWNDHINPLAVGIKTAWRISTVSPSYLDEMRHQGANGLEWLLHYEQHKTIGILNGIDYQVWDPTTDVFFRRPFNRGKFRSV